MKSTLNTKEVEQEIINAAVLNFGDNFSSAFFEHGQWFIVVDNLDFYQDEQADYYAVVDCVSPNGVRYFDFEEL